MERNGATPEGAEQFSVKKNPPKVDRMLFDQTWNRQRATNRINNIKIATGWIHTGSGVTYMERGIARKVTKRG